MTPVQEQERPTAHAEPSELRKRRKPNRGNFANDPRRAVEAGRKGGKSRRK